MRPRSLEVEGLGPFRERVELGFEDCDLFAFTGPTGSGKSSLVDAMVFALYGSVPRYGKRGVAPVVTQGRLQGRVRLVFTLGAHEYTAVRSVRLDARKRVNQEARLERGDQVLAGSPPEVTEAVEALIGLDFDQFTKCVVLPQGEFDGFLHAKPADRQGLLVALLDLGIYDRVAESARIRQAAADGEVAAIERRLRSAEEVTPETLASAEKHVAALERLLERVEAAVPRLEALSTERSAAAEEEAKLARRLQRLTEVRVPEGLAGLAKRLDELREEVTVWEKKGTEAEASVAAAEDSLASLPERADLVSLRDRWRQRSAVTEEIAELSARTQEYAEVLEAARRSHEIARERLERIRREHEAAHLRAGLEVGEPCPVCLRDIEEVPTAEEPGALTDAEATEHAASQELVKADRDHTSAVARLAASSKSLEALIATLESTPGEIDATLAKIDALVDARALARSQRDEARRKAARARAGLEALGAEERAAKRDLQRDLLVLAEMDPPALDVDDLAGAWEALTGWAAESLPGLAALRERALQKVAELEAGIRETTGKLQDACVEAGVEVAGRSIRDAVVTALATSRARREQMGERLEEVRQLGLERDNQAVKATVAKALAGHLRANNFEKWLLDEALRVLADGANRRLAELARGQYSLSLDSKLDFEVIDHQAADERRSVQSLSGGETFLVSLALALSLADHIAEMSAVGTSRLEAIFLDEGFGTLDPESLEAVASVISEIGAGGKMVGIITHVKELAEMVPCRFEVKKDAVSARVRRHDS